ncbi:MAG: UDP-N-acetylmuramate dehydrogenase [Roseburia sp.]|nr:UDP-N-acetylmuramate dehydrogenase [Roseburia sp.]
MISEAVIKALKGFVPEDNIYLQEPMSRHTTFRVGGPADCLIELENRQQLAKVQNYLHKIELPTFILGNGSNLLVSDKGYRGIVLQLGNRMDKIEVEGSRVTCQAGVKLSQAAIAAMENGLTGLEFAAGIPGTVGGGVVMNAGAYDGEMSQVVKSVTVLDREGEFLELDNDTMEFGYRHSTIRNQPFIVTEVSFELRPGDKESVRARIEELAIKRREKQPLEFPSAGSTFKRPEGYFAGELIMKAGLRGCQLGGARVSDKHCGFIINAGGATAGDIRELIEHVQQRVKEVFNIWLEPEIVFLGNF